MRLDERRRKRRRQANEPALFARRSATLSRRPFSVWQFGLVGSVMTLGSIDNKIAGPMISEARLLVVGGATLHACISDVMAMKDEEIHCH